MADVWSKANKTSHLSFKVVVSFAFSSLQVDDGRGSYTSVYIVYLGYYVYMKRYVAVAQ